MACTFKSCETAKGRQDQPAIPGFMNLEDCYEDQLEQRSKERANEHHDGGGEVM